MNNWISAPTRYLTDAEQRNNAKIIGKFFLAEGWTKNAIAGMLGNIEVESTVNPGLWQGREVPPDIYTTEKGYGLTQWTPARKYITWADENGLTYTAGDSQLARIKYERENGLQWSTDNILGYTWDDYVTSTESPETLARVFVWAYERPADPDIPLRQKNARYWYNFLSGVNGIPLWLLFKIKEANTIVKTAV